MSNSASRSRASSTGSISRNSGRKSRSRASSTGSIKGKSKREAAKPAVPRAQNDYAKSDVSLLNTWKKKTSSKIAKNRGKNKPLLLDIDRLLGEYEQLGQPQLAYTQAHKDKLREIDQQLDQLLKDPGSRQDAAEELQAFIQGEIQKSERNIDIDSAIAWDRENVSAVMTGGVRETLSGQNNANALVWFHTMFSPGKNPEDPDYNQEQEDILKQQQEFLKKHFFALASLGILAGDQKTDTYQPLENFTADNGDRVGLATVVSGGGLFNFRSSDGAGEGFRDFQYGVEGGKIFNREQAQLKKVKPVSSINSNKDRLFTEYLGAYKRNATHGNQFSSDGTIKELNKGIFSSEEWTGINIPIGGIGQHLQTTKGTQVTTGYQGRSNDGKSSYQTGTTLFQHYQQGQLSNTLIGFEGSAPRTENIHGGSHGAAVTIAKKTKGAASAKTLTGQGKRTEWGVKSDDLEISKTGGRIAEVSQAKLNVLKQQWSTFQNLPVEQQQEFFQKLLLTTTQQQRDDLFQAYNINPPQNRDPISSQLSSPSSSSDSRSRVSNPPNDDQPKDVPPPPPILDLNEGVILDSAKPVFRRAYRQDIRNGAYLTEAAGHIIANELGIRVRVYNQLPDGFVSEYNPGDGNCLLHSLLQAKDRNEKQQHSIEELDKIIAEQDYRGIIADRITDEDIDQLAVAALNAQLDGNPEPGLGRSIRGLLSHRDVSTYRANRNRQRQEPASQAQPASISPSSPSSSQDIAPQAEPAASVIATYGNDQNPLLEGVALIHTGGNHYQMIYRSI